MTYAEAVEHLEEFYQLQEDKCEKCEQALAVLRRAEPLIAAAERADQIQRAISLMNHSSSLRYVWVIRMLDAALAFREGGGKEGREKP